MSTLLLISFQNNSIRLTIFKDSLREPTFVFDNYFVMKMTGRYVSMVILNESKLLAFN